MARAIISPKFHAWDRNGKPLAFGKVYTYQARTNIPKATYQSEDQVVPNTNPVILNGEGYANVYLDGSYKIVVKDKNENEIWTADPVTQGAGDGDTYSQFTLTGFYSSPTQVDVLGDYTAAILQGMYLTIGTRKANGKTKTKTTTVVSSTYDEVEGKTTIVTADPIVTTEIEFVSVTNWPFEQIATIDEFVESTDQTLITPQGRTEFTMHGIVTTAFSKTASVPINNGEWEENIVFNAYNEFMVYNGQAYKPKPTTTLPYVSTVTPDLAQVEPFSDLNTSNVSEVQNQVTGLFVWPVNTNLTAQVGDILSAGTNALRDSNLNRIFKLSEEASGQITALDFNAGTATIGGVNLSLNLYQPLDSSTGTVAYTQTDKSPIENMIDDFNLNPIAKAVGTIIKTGGTTWRYDDQTGPITIDNFHVFGAVNVMDCGAVGDGLTDDSDAIEYAFSIVKSGGAVFFPKTRWAQTGGLEPQYLITRDIVITRADLGIYGDTSSEYTTGILCNTPNVKMFNFKNPGSRISNLAFFGNGSNTEFGTTTGIYIDRRDNGDSDNFANLDFIVDQCLFFDCGTGVHGFGRNVNVVDCLFTHLKVSIRCSSWIPAVPDPILGTKEHVDIRGWRIRGNRFHSNGWQYNYPGSVEVPPSTFGTWDSLCIQMPTDSDNFRHCEVVDNNADRGCSMFYRGMVSGLTMMSNTFHDFNGALIYGLTTTQGAKDVQNEYPSKICDNHLVLRESYDQPYDVPKTFGIIISDCDNLTLDNNTIRNTLQEAVKLNNCNDLSFCEMTLINAGQEVLQTTAFPAATFEDCEGLNISAPTVKNTYGQSSFNTIGLNFIGTCRDVGLENINIKGATQKTNVTPVQLKGADSYSVGFVNPTLNTPFTYNSGPGYNRLFSGETVVNLRVLGNGAASGTVIFTLPAGCRPAQDVKQNGVGSTEPATINIGSNGDVTLTYTGSASPLYAIDMQFPSQ